MPPTRAPLQLHVTCGLPWRRASLKLQKALSRSATDSLIVRLFSKARCIVSSSVILTTSAASPVPTFNKAIMPANIAANFLRIFFLIRLEILILISSKLIYRSSRKAACLRADCSSLQQQPLRPPSSRRPQ